MHARSTRNEGDEGVCALIVGLAYAEVVGDADGPGGPSYVQDTDGPGGPSYVQDADGPGGPSYVQDADGPGGPPYVQDADGSGGSPHIQNRPTLRTAPRSGPPHVMPLVILIARFWDVR